ncbi:hypothetical protein AMJ80_06555 [bacterium SM23_31]|nr:MAG: hypothetical protein AMJ80_06555 [bacterium SM23_31]
MFEFHTSALPESTPSSISTALPSKTISSFIINCDSSCGERIVATGVLFTSVPVVNDHNSPNRQLSEASLTSIFQ